ncbi:MAG: RdgB/HAM1 family non-canonical purine NTP pyrophosphatase [Alistipes sp.]|nr:RdgB/HAM1 family non-canonical purine NTP pyrophosphatase [Candidatus Minthomonas equi]
MQIIFATGNPHKLLEAQEILGPDFQLRTPADYGITEDIPETSDTIRGNALQKARYIFQKTGLPCFSDDTGLEVDALGGAPGVHTARYAGEGKNFDDNVNKLLSELQHKAPFERRARFRCCVAFIAEDGSETVFDGTVEGFITEGRCGTRGFGYDPVFRPEGYDLTFSELSQEQKNAISHRGKAMRALAAYLKELIDF